MNKKYDATVAGHICLDIIPEFPDTGIKEITKLFIPGKLIQVSAAKISTGGPVSNTGIALTKLGLRVAYMAQVGNDYFGKLIIDMLTSQGSADGISISDTHPTSYTIAIAPPGIDRIFLHDPGTNDQFSALNLNKKIIAQSGHFHFGYPPIMAQCYCNEGDELARIFRIAKSAGVSTSLDMALPDPNSVSGKAPWKRILEKVLPYVDIFLPSIEEAFFMLNPEKYITAKSTVEGSNFIDYIEPQEYSELAELCLLFGAKIVALKAAHRGMYVMTRTIENKNMPFIDAENWSNRELWCPAFRVSKIASATGSGDSAIAGFLAAYFHEKTIEQTLKYANCLGFQNLHTLDAVSGIKSWDETTTLLKSNKLSMIDISLLEHGWKWDDDMQLWIGKKDRK